ncbi:MAG: GNAT family N-acetyltransferase [Defluviitaleaceae bacterium]|nr:GNAT family N-acetyltransferase [Defluviitaleaceae bacterium]
MPEKIQLREGFVEFHQVADFADIHDIEVKLEHRGQGYGKKLMTLFLKEMKQRDVREVTLEVRVDNVVAIGLYEQCGFECVSVRKGYYRGVDGLLMKLECR